SISAASYISLGMDEIAPKNIIKLKPIYLHTEVPAKDILITSGFFSQCVIKSPKPIACSTVSSVPSGLKKNRNMKPMATPFNKYGKNRTPLKKFLNLTLKLKIVAKYNAIPN